MNYTKAFISFSVKDIGEVRSFYAETLGLNVEDDKMGLKLKLPGGLEAFIYSKDDHVAATFTMLNFQVDNIDEAVQELSRSGVKFEHYDEGMIKTDEQGIARGKAAGIGPDIAWFKDPAGNILSILQS